MPGGMPGGMMMPGMGGPGGPGGMPMPGMGGRRGGRRAPRQKPLTSIRVVLVTDEGQLDSGAFEVKELDEEDGWSEAKVPFSKLKGPGGKEGAKLTGLILTGNSGGSFYIGHVELTGG